MLSSKNKSQKLEPQLVLNPITKKYINISPLWIILQEFYNNNPKEFACNVEMIIRRLSLENLKDITPEQEKDMLFDLYNVKDILDHLCDIKDMSY